MMRSVCVVLLLLAGCFDSLLGTPCREGFTAHDGRCVAGSSSTPDAGLPDPVSPDATDVLAPDAGDASTCSAELASDPLNCGSCGNACASGICVDGACSGEPFGHVIAIGHDYVNANAPMLRVLGNAVALGVHHDVGIARIGASASVSNALATATALVDRPWHAVPLSETLAAADVVVIDPRSIAAEAAELEGVSWKQALAAFVDRGGVVIVLESDGGSNHRFAHGAELFTTSAPVVVTGAHLGVVGGGDALASHVVSPYFAAASSVAFPSLPAVVAAPGGAAVVYHAAVP